MKKIKKLSNSKCNLMTITKTTDLLVQIVILSHDEDFPVHMKRWCDQIEQIYFALSISQWSINNIVRKDKFNKFRNVFKFQIVVTYLHFVFKSYFCFSFKCNCFLSVMKTSFYQNISGIQVVTQKQSFPYTNQNEI